MGEGEGLHHLVVMHGRGMIVWVGLEWECMSRVCSGVCVLCVSYCLRLRSTLRLWFIQRVNRSWHDSLSVMNWSIHHFAYVHVWGFEEFLCWSINKWRV